MTCWPQVVPLDWSTRAGKLQGARCRATPNSRHHTTAQQARHHSILQVPVPSAYLGSRPLATFTLSDSTFGFGSEISYTFIFWLYFLDDNHIMSHSPPCNLLHSITKAHKASMEQIADLYALDNTIEATVSTSRNTGSSNANGGLFA